MKKSKLLLLPIAVILLAGCMTFQEVKTLRKMNKFTSSAEAYEKAIKWSDFEAASFFVKHMDVKPDLDRLKQVKVTSYEVKKIVHRKAQLKVHQTIELSYYWKDTLTEKTIRFQELWEYDETDRSWYLGEGFPEFK